MRYFTLKTLLPHLRLHPKMIEVLGNHHRDLAGVTLWPPESKVFIQFPASKFIKTEGKELGAAQSGDVGEVSIFFMGVDVILKKLTLWLASSCVLNPQPVHQNHMLLRVIGSTTVLKFFIFLFLK